MLKKIFIIVSFILSSAQASDFSLIALGNKGGILDGNLTAFLLKSQQDSHYIMLDAGTVVNGLTVAEQQGAFNNINVPKDSPYTKIGYVLHQKIKGYLISHAHLDHLAGMIIASPDDSPKPIYGLSSVNNAISDNYFNWSAWPNFGNEGQGYQLKKYNYIHLKMNTWSLIAETSMQVNAFPLSHSGIESTAFLLKDKNGNIIAYFGDTGADEVENSKNLNQIWSSLAPFVKEGRLKGIIIEVSYPNETSDKFLYGHLTPNWLLKELSTLEALSGGADSLKGLNIVISHIKYSLKKDENPKEVIKHQLQETNELGVNFIFLDQGETIEF